MAREAIIVHPPSAFVSGANPFALAPVGLFSLAARALQEGFEVEIVNVPLEAALSGKPYAEVVKELDATVYAVSLHWFVHAEGALATVRLLKAVNPSAKVVVGGMTATLFAEEVARSGADAVVLGEGEEGFIKYLRYSLRGEEPRDWSGLYARVGRRWVNGGLSPPPDVRKLSYAEGLRVMRHAREYFRIGLQGPLAAQQPHFWVALARGCVFDCIYCGGSREGYALATGRQGLATRDPALVASELEELAQQGIRIARLTHDPQILGEKWWRAFLKEVRERELDLRVYWESFRLPTKPLLEEASKTFAALDVAISPETASEEVRFKAKRYFTNAALERALSAAEKVGALIELFFLIGLPGESEETARSIPKFASKLVRGRRGALVYPLIPYTIDPNSPMALHPDEYGVRVLFRRLSDYARAAMGSRTEDFIGHETRELSRRRMALLIEELNEQLAALQESEAVEQKLAFEEKP